MTLTETVSAEQLQERTVGMKLEKKCFFLRRFAIKRERKEAVAKEELESRENVFKM